MSQKPVNPYLKTKIMTASPEELRLMLYDGALKFCRQARAALEKKNYEESYNNLMRAQKIVLELSTSLNHDADPQLCQRLSALYTYVYRLLVDANMQRKTSILDEAIKLIEYERETWRLLMEKLASQGKPSETSITTAQQTAISSLSQSA
ncbi:MAG: flagellar export chaperone FliS [Phycisphaeraceae bacterium]